KTMWTLGSLSSRVVCAGRPRRSHSPVHNLSTTPDSAAGGSLERARMPSPLGGETRPRARPAVGDRVCTSLGRATSLGAVPSFCPAARQDFAAAKHGLVVPLLTRLQPASGARSSGALLAHASSLSQRA